MLVVGYLNVLLQHMFMSGKWYDCKIIFVFCSAFRFVENVLLLRLTVYSGKRKSKRCMDIKFLARKLLWREHLCELLVGILEKLFGRVQTGHMV